MSVVVWFTGLPSSGKTTLAKKVQKSLSAETTLCCLLDSDELRDCFAPKPGYSPEERERFYATIARLAGLLARQGVVTLVAATANRVSYRESARKAAPRFLEVYVATPIEECRRRDAKGLYAKADAGEVFNVPGADAAYDPPPDPDVVDYGNTAKESVEAIVSRLHSLINQE